LSGYIHQYFFYWIVIANFFCISKSKAILLSGTQLRKNLRMDEFENLKMEREFENGLI
jgi:hypothetical protein